jgi:hypothetical protein
VACFAIKPKPSKSPKPPQPAKPPNKVKELLYHPATRDEFFTLSIGGMATVLNSSAKAIMPGDMVEWTVDTKTDLSKSLGKRESGPRRIGIQTSKTAGSAREIGRALSFARRGETLDILIKQ